jgi:hypothetical protein
MKNVFLISLILLFCCYSCHKKDCFSPPDSFRLTLLNANGTSVINENNKDNIQLLVSNTSNNVETPISVIQYHNVAQDSVFYFIEATEVPWKSLSGNKNFLMTINNDTIALFVDVSTQTIDQCTTHHYDMVSCNGTLLTDYDDQIGAFIAIE